MDTGLFDFQKTVVAVKIHFPKLKPQVIRCWKYIAFYNKTFLDPLRHELNIQRKFENETSSDAFPAICTGVLDKHDSKRYVKSNNKYLANNEISNAIMTRTTIKNCFLQHTRDQN